MREKHEKRPLKVSPLIFRYYNIYALFTNNHQKVPYCHKNRPYTLCCSSISPKEGNVPKNPLALILNIQGQGATDTDHFSLENCSGTK